MRSALVTGINGQDGSYMADFLLDKGYKVFGMERRSSRINRENTGHLEDNENFQFLNGDLVDQNSLLRCLKLSDPDEIYNSEEVQGRVNGFAEAMHKAGASSSAVEAALQWYWGQEAAGQEAMSKYDREHQEAAEAELRKEWGSDYDGNKNFAQDFVKQYGGEDLLKMELKDGTLLGSNPYFARMAAEAGRRVSEGGLQMGVAGTEAGQDIQKSYDELSDQIYDAHRRGEVDKARRLDAERSELSKQLFGDRNIGAA